MRQISVRNKQQQINQAGQIKISKDGTCYDFHSEPCVFVNSAVCNTCSVTSGNPNQSIKFSTYKVQEPIRNVSGRTVTEQSNESDEKVWQQMNSSIIIDDDEDTPKFTNFVSPEIVHSQTNNSHFHKHFLVNEECFGTRCFLCGREIVGSNICPQCESTFT